jgi:hypothetical protein
MISLNRIVLIPLGDVAGGGQQPVEHPRIGRRPIGGYLGRTRPVLEGAGEEPTGGRQVPFFGDENVDDLAVLADRPIEIDPPAGDLDVGLIDEPTP